MGIAGSARQQLDVPGSHRANLNLCISHSPAQSALGMEGRWSSWAREDLGHQSLYAIMELVVLCLVQLCLFFL